MRIAQIAVWIASLGIVALPARAALVISTGTTANVQCTQGQYARVCTATAANAALNVGKLKTLLASQNVNVATGTATNNIIINAALSWASASGLSLLAQRSIVVNAPVTAAGTGTELGLQLGSGGYLSFGPNGHIGFWDTTSSLLVINNQGYGLVNSVAALALRIGNNPSGRFALAGNYDATPDGTYTQAPVQADFTGVFEGLGNTISNLSISDPADNDWVGLFRVVDPGGRVQNLRLTKANVSAAGYNAYVGGITGNLSQGHLLRDCVSGKVSATGLGVAGGLTGSSQSQGQTVLPMIEGSCSAAAVSTAYIGGGLAGGFVGEIRNSYASGKVTGGDATFLGGLVGEISSGTIQDSHATGKVIGGSGADAGGLVGRGNYDCSVSTSFATGAVSAGDNSKIGGLLGENLYCAIGQSYATGQVSGSQNVDTGGLIGSNSGNIDDTYATGAVTASSGNNGGLIGSNGYDQYFPSVLIQSSYSIGAVSGGFDGGLVGYDNTNAGSFSHTYWDTTTSGITNPSQGAGAPANDPGIAPRATWQLRAGLPKGFSSSIWGEKSTVNNGLPYLLAVPTG